MTITLVPKTVAKIGYKFVHVGELEECKNCPLRKVCIEPLVKDSLYEVVQLRKKEHKCPIDGTIMIVCDVEERNPVINIINTDKALEGIIITREPIKCDEILCEYYDKCVSKSFDDVVKVKIVKKIRKINCPIGLDLFEAEVKKVKE